ncbi:MAG: radical SAM protein [Clostridia bacterium]|nr:radical SAM protein [Clostridia bacterium]
MRIRLHMTASPIYTLGPYARFGVWVQGCGRHCPGCVTPDSQSMTEGKEEEVEALARRILQEPSLEGLTISGGEPFLQEEALCELIRTVRRFAPLGVILYTGYLYEEIASRPLAGLCDAIIDGPYVDELNDGGSMRGSANQRLILLTPRYEGLIPFGTLPRKTELVEPGEGGLAQVGVPSREDVERAHILQEALLKGENT